MAREAPPPRGREAPRDALSGRGPIDAPAPVRTRGDPRWRGIEEDRRGVDQRLRHLQDRRRAVELAHDGPLAGGPAVRGDPRRPGRARPGRVGPRRPLRLARQDRQGARDRRRRPDGPGRRGPRHLRPLGDPPQVAAIRSGRRLALGGRREIPFDFKADLVFHFDRALPFHPNGLRFSATMEDGSTHSETFYSIGGGFVVREGDPDGGGRLAALPMPIETPADLDRPLPGPRPDDPRGRPGQRAGLAGRRGDPRGPPADLGRDAPLRLPGDAGRRHPAGRPGRGPPGRGDEPRPAGRRPRSRTSTPGWPRSARGAASSARPWAG